MRSKTFSRIALTGIPMVFVAYFLVVDRLVMLDQPFSFGYQYFLLEAAADITPKIVIASGSNSTHAIDADELGRAFQIPAINWADNGSYPLREKVYALDRFLRPGDILLLPLEWGYYVRDDALPENYVEDLVKSGRAYFGYYRYLPLREKTAFAFQDLPPPLVMELLPRYNRRLELQKERALPLLSIHQSTIEREDRKAFGSTLEDGPVPIGDRRSSVLSCDDYLGLPAALSDGMSVSFEKNLERLSKLSERGVRVIFAWPTVVDRDGDGCYRRVDPNAFAEYVSALRARFLTYGFSFIGEPEDSRYGKDCFLNTFYHIRASCAGDRTAKLIQDLRAAGLVPAENPDYRATFKRTVSNHIHSISAAMLSGRLSGISPIGEKSASGLGLAEHVVFETGWGPVSKVGVWSVGEVSSLYLRTESKGQRAPVKLHIDGEYLDGAERTEVLIDGVSLGRFILLDALITLPAHRKGTNLVHVVLKHSNPVSPASLGLGPDKRPLKYRLNSMSIHYGQTAE